MRVVAFVPMKLNNRRLPNKNTKPFTDGKPLCHYILSTLVGIKEIDKVYAYCSSPGIQDYLPKGVAYLGRDISLDRDETSISSVLCQFAREVPADIYVLAHATAPFLCAASIKRGLEAVSSGGYDSAFAAKKVQDFLWGEGKPLNYDPANIPRTQDLPGLYAETSGFYIYRRSVVEEHGRRVGEKPFLVEVGEIEGIDIDREEDFMIADAVFYYRQKLCGGGDFCKDRLIYPYGMPSLREKLGEVA